MAPAPNSRRGDQTDTFFGTEVADPYRWLEEADSDETQAWIQAQVAHTTSVLEAAPNREEWRSLLEDLWQHDRFGIPVQRGERWFQTYAAAGRDQPVLAALSALDGERQTLFDPLSLASDGTVALTNWVPSPDGRFVAIGLSDGGSDWTTWRVVDVATAALTADTVRWVKFSAVSWLPDASGFVYGRYPEAADGDALAGVNRNYQLRRHLLGEDQSADTLVLQDPGNPEHGFGSSTTDDGEAILVHVWRGSADKNDLLMLDPTDLQAPPVALFSGFTASWLVAGKRGSKLLLTTNQDAPRGRVVVRDLSGDGSVTTLVAESDEAIESATVVGDRLLVCTLAHATTRVRVFTLDGEPLGELALPGPGTATGFTGAPEAREAHFLYTSFSHPGSVFSVDLATLTVRPVFVPKVPFDPSALTTTQTFATSPDGTRVPVFVVRRSDVVADGSAPALLTGYGGFNIALTPAFSASNLAWLLRGGVLAVANLRGGGEYGETWHKAGTQLHKQRVFDDFVAAAEHLIAEGWTTSSRLAIRGGSNGGLLVGACLLQRPELFAAAVPQVGVLDMLRYHRFTIGWAWAQDYGTVDDSEQMFRALLDYSPVHRCRPGRYPATLITTADHDDRVVPAHSYKFAAALQQAQTGEAPVLIRIDTRAGHGAGKSVSMLIDEAVDLWSFVEANTQN